MKKISEHKKSVLIITSIFVIISLIISYFFFGNRTLSPVYSVDDATMFLKKTVSDEFNVYSAPVYDYAGINNIGNTDYYTFKIRSGITSEDFEYTYYVSSVNGKVFIKENNKLVTVEKTYNTPMSPSSASEILISKLKSSAFCHANEHFFLAKQAVQEMYGAKFHVFDLFCSNINKTFVFYVHSVSGRIYVSDGSNGLTEDIYYTQSPDYNGISSIIFNTLDNTNNFNGYDAQEIKDSLTLTKVQGLSFYKFNASFNEKTNEFYVNPLSSYVFALGTDGGLYPLTEVDRAYSLLDNAIDHYGELNLSYELVGKQTDNSKNEEQYETTYIISSLDTPSDTELSGYDRFIVDISTEAIELGMYNRPDYVFLSKNEYFYDGFIFTLENDNATIIGYHSIYVPYTFEIPAYLGNAKVTGVDIDYQFFSNSNSIKKIILPETLETINSSCFYRFYSLESVHIPKNITSIEEDAFFRCSSLKEITVDPSNEHFTAKDGVLYSKDMTKLITFPEGKDIDVFVIPETVKTVDGAFGYHPLCKTFDFTKSQVTFQDRVLTAYDDITIICKKDSPAHKYALKMEYKVILK